MAVTVVTYKRPNYLFWTLDSFFQNNPGLRAAVPVYVLVQGTRPMDTADTEDVLNELSDRWGVNIHRIFPNANLGCGMGFTEINRVALKNNPAYVLCLQDDWKTEEPFEKFLPECLEAFRSYFDLGAIRLRSVTEPVLPTNLVSGKPIIYRPATGNVWIGNAHFTFNPVIIRGDVLHRMLPVLYEDHARKRYHALGYRVGQLRASCFVHIGDRRVPDWKK